MPQLRSVDQLGFDEQTIEDAELEAALEERDKRKRSLDAVRKVYDGAHQAALGEIEKLELPEGGAARVGRFRVTRTAVPARSIAFDTKASSRIRIGLVGEDDIDLRPKGEVNTDLLRGEADRASSEG